MLFTLKSNIEQDNDTRMLMHFLADPAMTVVSGVAVGNLRNKSVVHVGVQTEVKVPNQDNEQPDNCEGTVGDHCTTVKLEPTWTSTFLREQQVADSDLKVIIGWKKAGERKPSWEEVSPQSSAVKA